jgi:pimeloyl-ACP methyl ester carboxylesterase
LFKWNSQPIKTNQQQMRKNQRSVWAPGRIALGVYVVLIFCSHMFQSMTGGMNDQLLPGRDRSSVGISNRGDDGEMINGEMLDVVYEQWGEWIAGEPDERTPVLLMHGAPGMGTDFNRIGGLLTVDNRRVYAPDMVGFAMSDMGENVSYRVQARHMFSFLDEMGVDRVHLVGWSNGGGVGLRMAEYDADRIASLTMLASVGAQETEGSGSYFFEHVKYAVGMGLLGYIPDLIPHFGLLGTRDLRIGWLWSFWDSDQRELTRIMPTIETPVMILHGRDDPLVSADGAEQHHAMMPSSKLVMLDASHFLPFQQSEETAEYLNSFFARHDQRGVPAETSYVNLAPVPQPTGVGVVLRAVGDWIAWVPWWGQLVGLVILIRRWPTVGVVVAMIFVSMLKIDFGVMILSMLLGRSWWLWRGAGVLDRPWTTLRWLRGVLFVVPMLIISMIGSSVILRLTESFGVAGLVLGILLVVGAIHFVRLFVSWEGRLRIRGWIARVWNHEYWPTGIIYIMVLWWGFKRVISGKGLHELTSVNPGYASDGGIRNESKDDINRKFGDEPSVLDCRLVRSNESVQARFDDAVNAINTDDRLGGYPVICKPDRGERGRGVRLLRDESGLRRYCEKSDEDFVMQRYHPGPVEVGVLWVRECESITDPNHQGSSGFIYSINVKHFPVITGDGKHPLRKLILMHSRYRAQASVFFEHLRDELSRIPEEGEEVQIGFAGNHAQGAMFTDGQELITDALTDRMNSIVDGFVDEHGRGFDVGRFDLRCESLDLLSRGEGFGIIELNGLTSEPTNLYDPKRSIVWAWRMLLGYWKHVERLAQARVMTGTGHPVDHEEWGEIKLALVRVMAK